ncbi:MAG TPA: hypothetical protein VHR55_05850 [Candidatus Limnocylindria bacterium]|nr:hypothetical protein [Candidatus Limnocylindria bacterium]
MASAICPRGHVGAPVVLAGTYGIHKHRRQLFWCRAPGSEHRFSEPLPRALLSSSASCVECLKQLERHEGPPHPRHYQFPARQIAWALLEVAGGMSYRGAGDLAREKAKRIRRNALAGGGVSDAPLSGNLVGDWVEVFAPVLWKQHGPAQWPRIIEVDEGVLHGRSIEERRAARLPFPLNQQARAAAKAAGKKMGGRKLFHVLGAHARGGGKIEARPVLFQTSQSGIVDDWITFFEALPGRPEVIVGDSAYPWQKAAKHVWRGNVPELVISEWHLRQMIDGHLKRLRVPYEHELWNIARRSLRGPTEWATFVILLTAIGDPRLERWLNRWDTRVAEQLDRHAIRWVPRSTAEIEKSLGRVEHAIEDRRALFSNKARTDRLLMLITLQLRGEADERAWAHTIREWLMSRGGKPPRQRQIRDRRGISSLRFR